MYMLNMRWDETNRMTASDRNGFIANYLYDAQGIRAMKIGMSQENVYLNSKEHINLANIETFTLYPSKYQTLRNSKGQLTNHYYIGNERFASKTANYHFPDHIKDGSHYTKEGNDNSILPILSAENIAQNLTEKSNALRQRLHESYANFGYALKDSINYAVSPIKYDHTYQLPDSNSMYILDSITVQDSVLHFYHPNHLGSTAFVSDASGEVVQYIEYLPFGGTFLERRKGYNSQYTYTGKEKDIETDLYDYGARYYDDEIGRFYGVDPMKDKYAGLSSYNYVMNNPIILIDPDGLEPTEGEAAAISAHVYGHWNNKMSLPGGWQVSNRYFPGTKQNSNSGLKSAIYERQKDNGSIEYTYATAGTDGANPFNISHLMDWNSNIDQAVLGVVAFKSQYKESAINAELISNELGGNELTFVGHSLGGGLASLNSLVTGRPGITFNSAFLNPRTKRRFNVNMSTNIKAFYTPNDPINKFSNSIFFPYAEGLRTPRIQKFNDAHTIGNFLH